MMLGSRPWQERIGLASLVRRALTGGDLVALRTELEQKAEDAGSAMDLAVVEQLLGNREHGLRIQERALARATCFRTAGGPSHPRLRVLALAASLDIGGNTPIEFLIRSPDIELTTLYVVPGRSDIYSLFGYDVIVVVSSDDYDAVTELVASARRIKPDLPVLNDPDKIGRTDRDTLWQILADIEGLHIVPTLEMTRADLIRAATEGFRAPLTDPAIVRPKGSHAGYGLKRIDHRHEIAAFLADRPEDLFYASTYVDYSSADGLFRKYRIAIIDGKPFACHLAIADQWAIWYLNADMAGSAKKRAEEQDFIENFETGFGSRHGRALSNLAARVGLDYLIIDCAETREGELFLFEAGIAMIVHDLDPSDLFPYRVPQMRLIAQAFEAMLERRSTRGASHERSLTSN